MNDKDLNNQITEYKKLLSNGLIQKTYESLVNILQNVRTDFLKELKKDFKIAGLLHGYLDVTYFYMQNDFLKEKNLKYAIVLNHQNANFELWLLGQTKNTQIEYWKKFKDTKWITSKKMPKYSVFQVVILDSPDFNRPEEISNSILTTFKILSDEIFSTLREIC